MALGINTSTLSSLSTLLQTGRNQNALGNSLNALSSGLRINRAADDAAGLAIANQLNAEQVSLSQSQRNVLDSNSALGIAEGGLSGISDILSRGRALAVQASNAFLNPQQRQAIQAEFSNLRDELNNISASTSFNGKNLLDGTFAPGAAPQNVQAGTGNSPGDTISLNVIPQTDATSLGLAGVDLSTVQGAQSALTSFDSAIQSVSATRGDIGALQNRLGTTLSNLAVSEENVTAAKSRIQDLDFAKGISDFQRQNILSQAGYNALGKGLSTSQQNIGRLLNFSA